MQYRLNDNFPSQLATAECKGSERAAWYQFDECEQDIISRQGKFDECEYDVVGHAMQI